MTALIWVVFENQELLFIIIHVIVGSVTEPWGGALRDDTKKEPSTGYAFLPFFLRIYANQKPRKNSIGYVHSSGKPGCGARVQKHRHTPEIGHKAGVQGQDRSLLRSRSGRSHAILPAPTNLFQCDIHSLNSFSIVLRICQLVPMSSSFY